MLDESLCDMAAVERLAATHAAPLAHLKLAKLGGLDRLMQAGRILEQAGIPVMVGQMNEGSPSTLAAAMRPPRWVRPIASCTAPMDWPTTQPGRCAMRTAMCICRPGRALG